MKNLLVFASVLLVSGIVMVSCSKDEKLIETKTLETTLIEVNVDETINNFTNDYAYFESDAALRSFFSQYQNSSFEKREELTGKVNYLTFDKHLDAIYEGMNDLTTRDAFVNYINNYSDLMEIKTMNAEEEVVEKEISRHPITPFLNVDRIIKVADEYRKYIGEFYIASEDYADLADINSIADMEKSKLDYKRAITLQSGLIDKGPDEFFDEEFNDNRWCKNDRKVEIFADFRITPTSDSIVGTV